MESQQQQTAQQLEQEFWQIHQNLERGNPVRVYRGQKLVRSS